MSSKGGLFYAINIYGGTTLACIGSYLIYVPVFIGKVLPIIGLEQYENERGIASINAVLNECIMAGENFCGSASWYGVVSFLAVIGAFKYTYKSFSEINNKEKIKTR